MTRRQTIYAKYEKFEEQLAHCYFMLHHRFIEDRSLASLWADAAMDELHHLSILRFCRNHGAMTDFEPSAATAANIADLLETVKGIVADPEITVEEAFYASILMESSELDDIYKRLVQDLNQEHPILYQAVQSNLKSHYQAFSEGAARFCKNRAFGEAFRNMRNLP